MSEIYEDEVFWMIYARVPIREHRIIPLVLWDYRNSTNLIAGHWDFTTILRAVFPRLCVESVRCSYLRGSAMKAAYVHAKVSGLSCVGKELLSWMQTTDEFRECRRLDNLLCRLGMKSQEYNKYGMACRRSRVLTAQVLGLN